MSNTLRWTEEQLAEHKRRIKTPCVLPEPIQKKTTPQKPVKQSKHKNKITMVDGIKFHSMREAKRWQELKAMESAGLIKELRRQVPFVLAESVILQGRKKPAMRYIADFEYMQNNCLVVEDSKASHLRKDSSFRKSMHLMMSVHGIEIKLI